MLSTLVVARVARVARLNRTLIISSRLCDKKYFSQAIKYTDTHEWICEERDYTKVGLSKKAIDEMGELVYIDYSCKKGDVIKETEDPTIFFVTTFGLKTLNPS